MLGLVLPLDFRISAIAHLITKSVVSRKRSDERMKPCHPLLLSEVVCKTVFFNAAAEVEVQVLKLIDVLLGNAM